MAQQIAIVDYNMGNLHSVSKALERVCDRQTDVIVTDDIGIIGAADRIVFPGQGAMRECIAALDRKMLRDTLIKASADRPFLGICMGLQVLLEHSEEHHQSHGFGVIRGQALRFPDTVNSQRLKIPHMGWNRVWHSRPHPLWQGIDDGTRFYFVHSYYVAPANAATACGMTDYGVTFASAIAANSLFAVQFHPEKSQRDGLQLLANFVNWDGQCEAL